MLFLLAALLLAQVDTRRSHDADVLQGDNLCGGACSSHMVLAASGSRVWGFNVSSGIKVTVSVSGGASSSQRHTHSLLTSAVAAHDGRWSVDLPEQPAGAGHTVTITAGDATRVLSDVAFGLVLLCGGQSNMQVPVSMFENETSQWNQYPNIRMAQVCPGASGNGAVSPCKPSGRVAFSPAPQDSAPFYQFSRQEPNETWARATSKSVAPFSATCWYTAMHVHDTLENPPPIGLVHSSLSGSCVEAWTSVAGIAACSSSDGHCPGQHNAQHMCSEMFNGAIHPLLPTVFNAVLWYQGECNSADPVSYACRFPAMVADWRLQFKNEQLPFYFVELDAPQSPWMREAQRAALQLPHVDFVTAADIGCAPPTQVVPKCFGVHSHRKSEVGRRLSLHILKDLFNRTDVAVAGPQLATVDVVSSATSLSQRLKKLDARMPLPLPPSAPSPGAAIVLTFSPATSDHLHLNGTADCKFANDTSQSVDRSQPCCEISPFVFRTAGGKWVRSPTPPTIKSNTVTVPLPPTNGFAAFGEADLLFTDIAYNFETFPPCALYSGNGSGPDSFSGLPAAPFRRVLSARSSCPPPATLCSAVRGGATNPALQQEQCCTTAGSGMETCTPGLGCWGKYETLPEY